MLAGPRGTPTNRGRPWSMVAIFVQDKILLLNWSENFRLGKKHAVSIDEHTEFLIRDLKGRTRGASNPAWCSSILVDRAVSASKRNP